MGQALYRNYRPRKLSDVVGQEHVTKTLEQALKQGRISHAYLLTGPRGVGKTSVARILAHEINGLPYADDSAEMDIIEIDAASNRRIDEIRELRDKVYIAPTSAKYKVYIIDEVHMLTREAFNALLKTLEEPPEHAVFILATTDAHKLPETIVSRTQRYNFKPVSRTEVTDHLATIAKQEKIKVSPEALALLAEHGEGSFRDSISMLDQAANQDGKLELSDAQQLLGIPPNEAIDALLAELASGSDSASLMKSLHGLYDQGYQAAAISKRLGRQTRQGLVAGTPPMGSEQSMELLERLLTVSGAHDPAGLLEVIVLSYAQPVQKTGSKSVSIPPEPISELAKEPETPPVPGEPIPEEPISTPPEAEEAPVRVDKATAASKAAAKTTVKTGTAELDEAIWPEVLKALKQKHNTVYSIVRMGEPKFEQGTVQLVFSFAFHQKRLNESGNKQLLADTIKELTGQAVAIECLYDSFASPRKNPAPEPSKQPPKQADKAELSAISNIFGGGELLES